VVDFKDLRKEYETHGIDESELLDDPIAVFKIWFVDASESCPADWYETNAMTLSTSDGSGHVTSRVVLLKGIDEESIRFYTNYGSTKGQQLAANPRAAVNFHWPWLGRQVRMSGTVEKTSREDSETYFHSRPRGSQIGALASKQSNELESPEVLAKVAAELEAKHEGQPVPLPEAWGGYQLTPDSIEFWQGRLNRLHDRVVYRNQSGIWTRGRLSP